MSEEGEIRDSKLTDRFDWNSRDGVTYSADDWQVVEETLRYAQMDDPGDDGWLERGQQAIARLREREAQLEREVREWRDDAELKQSARVTELEEALRRIDESEYSLWNAGEEVQRLKRIARRALAHEEEK